MSSNVARLRPAEPLAVPAGTYLGPAVVRVAGALSVEVDLPDGRALEARLALGFTYQPAVGDTVLLIAQDEAYVIGVIASTGKGVLEFPGDLEVRAGGTLTLAGQQIAVSGREMRVHVGKLETVARAVTERFDNLRQRVSELLSVHAGESQTVVEGTSHLRAESASILTKEKVTLNGKAIHLG
jgi:hypothetical protein